MSLKEEVLRVVKEKGPIIPNLIKKEVGGDTFLIGAVLSELMTEGHVKISHTKIGNSPTYYQPLQEYKLLNLKKYLNEKDQRTLQLLRENKILRDRDQEMLTRVSLRNIKDFAKQLEVNVKGEKEIFWKWFQTPKEDVEKLIREKILGKRKVKEKKEKIEEKQDELPQVKNKREETYKTPIQKSEPTKTIESEKTEFSKTIYEYFKKKDIEVIEETIIRKNSDMEFKILIGTAVGKAEYFCKAKNKKKCNDGDLSSAYIKGQMMKLPTLFITTGEITKKAMDMLKNEFKGLVLQKI